MHDRIQVPAAFAALLVSAAALALCALPAPASAAKKAGFERFRHPDYASFQVRSIGILPVAILRPEREAARIVREQLEKALFSTGYRFVDEAVLHSTVRSASLTDTLEALEASWRKTGTLDTLALRALGEARVADAVLAPMITTWERTTIDPSAAGESVTQVGVRLALYSTRTGALLWRDSFLEEGRGPYNNPSTENVIGVQGSVLGTTARTSTALDPPSYQEIANKLARKVQAQFPPMPKAPASERESPKPATPAPTGSLGLRGADALGDAGAARNAD